MASVTSAAKSPRIVSFHMFIHSTLSETRQAPKLIPAAVQLLRLSLHLIILRKSSCRLLLSLFECTTLLIFVSSAYFLLKLLSLMYMTERTDPRTEPWETPRTSDCHSIRGHSIYCNSLILIVEPVLDPFVKLTRRRRKGNKKGKEEGGRGGRGGANTRRGGTNT